MIKVLLPVATILLSLAAASQNTFPSSGNVGIGTSSPTQQLHVAGKGFFTENLGIGRSTATSTNAAFLDVYGAGVSGNPHIMITNQNLSQWELRNDNSSNKLVLDFWSGSSRLSNVLGIDVNGNVGIGTATPNSFKLAVEGKIGARGVKVTLTSPWPDYVFRKSYRLMPLNELDQYIKQHHRLPEIPSAETVKREGIDLGEMDSKLIKKIEELTLYLIELKKENDEMKKQIEEISKSVAQSGE